MKTQVNDGGPAFPVLRENDNPSMSLIMASPGMTLRDYFAAKAMQSLISESATATLSKESGKPLEFLVASMSYTLAEAMLSERNKEQAK